MSVQDNTDADTTPWSIQCSICIYNSMVAYTDCLNN